MQRAEQRLEVGWKGWSHSAQLRSECRDLYEVGVVEFSSDTICSMLVFMDTKPGGQLV